MIGSLNKRITFQHEEKTEDGMGGYDSVWTDSSKAWAAIWPTSAKEQIQSAKETMVISHRIRVRYRSGILSSYRIKFRNRYFNIVSIINPEERNEWLDLLCKEAI